MNLFRLALPAAALAAVVSVYPVAAEEDPVRQFLNDEFSNTQATNEAAPAADQVADIDKNAWAGLVPAANTKQRAALAPALAPAAAGDNAPILALVDKHASANGIPAAFARAVVRIESNFNPKATGRQREVGLMQIKFETARGIGFAGTREQLYDPDTNLQWGMKYLAMAWKLGGSTPCGAVMKYQGGHGVMRPNAASNAYCAKVKSHMASAN
ncbi:MAG: transglycosylase SLT domain-containing protein [Xanthobacteraceae bacterium]|jgi:soluble lytic murein transglycosylase-like protein|nr:transglycosylase SLT domain-containing protein [Xanthobacteraceae bacterium]